MKKTSHYFFLGIGGIGMSALARYFNRSGFQVTGYDKTKTDLTLQLEAEGMSITYLDEVNTINHLPLYPETTLVVATPAVPANSQLRQYFQSEGFTILKRAEMLGRLTAEGTLAAVAGTHGKTTTSCLLAHLLHESQAPATAFLGGIATNYQDNYLEGDLNRFVAEADEFDRSFLQLNPEFAAITSTDADHLDIYGHAATVDEAFQAFALQVTNTLLLAEGVSLKSKPGVRVLTYGKNGDYRYAIKGVENGRILFDFFSPELTLTGLNFALPGNHNLMNATAALALALLMGAHPALLPTAIASFKGVKRRFERQFEGIDIAYIDDYAHHPTEIKALEQAVRQLYPGKKLTAVFQPHLFSRTRDFASGFAESLSLFDELILMPIYPARETPIPGITSEWLLQACTNVRKTMATHEQVLDCLKSSETEIVLTVGAGDIDLLITPIRNWMSERERRMA